jgi:alkaline phosphatase
VVVTADHETGGLVLTDGDIKAGRNECRFVTTNHSGVMVPVFAYGPGAERFTGIQQNTDIYKKIINLMGMK